MNKYQEALDYINKSICTLLSLRGIQDEQVIKNLHILQEVVDKATPKKIIKINAKDNPNVRKGSLTDMVGFTYQCPTCKANMGFLSVYNYCQHCGQAFDKEWKDE